MRWTHKRRLGWVRLDCALVCMPHGSGGVSVQLLLSRSMPSLASMQATRGGKLSSVASRGKKNKAADAPQVTQTQQGMHAHCGCAMGTRRPSTINRAGQGVVWLHHTSQLQLAWLWMQGEATVERAGAPSKAKKSKKQADEDAERAEVTHTYTAPPHPTLPASQPASQCVHPPACNVNRAPSTFCPCLCCPWGAAASTTPHPPCHPSSQ